jgi:hypothetical protein
MPKSRNLCIGRVLCRQQPGRGAENMKTLAIVLASGLAFAVPAFADSVTTSESVQTGGAVIVAPPISPPVAVAPSETKIHESSKTTDDGDRQVDKRSEKVETPFGSSSTTTKTVHQNDD